MIDELELEDCRHALESLLETNLISLSRLFNDFHAMMKKAHEEGVKPDAVPQDRANHILDLMIGLYPHLDVLKADFPKYAATVNWLEENCKRIFSSQEAAN
jgi:hypothetical protein